MPEDTEAARKLRPKERRYYTDEVVDDDEIDGKRTFNVEEKLKSSKYNKNFVVEMKGSDVNLKYFQENGLKKPIIVKEKAGLGMRVPSKNFTVNDVKQCVGSRRVLDVMDVNTQKALEMTMKEWTKYYENKERDRLLNVISLEFSHTRLENYVEQPEVVRQVDWIDAMWPRYLKESQSEATNVLEKMKYPKVQKYCLMSVKGCYTDFHIDMGGTSVWYHILHGKKVFWLIPPTEANLRLYEEWILSAKQGDVFFGDKVKDCQRIALEEGYSFFIPTGWIHAVFTPEDSLVFGGNYLHMFNVPMQLRIWEIESRTHVPSKFRYPFFTEIHWYVLERYLHCVTGKQHRTKSAEEIKEEQEEEEEDRKRIKADNTTDSKSESSSAKSEDAVRDFSPPRSPLEEEHYYGSNRRPSRPATPKSPRLLAHDDNVQPRSPRAGPSESRPLRSSQNSPRPSSRSGSTKSGDSHKSDSPGLKNSDSKIKQAQSELIRPVSVKLENCMLAMEKGKTKTLLSDTKPKTDIYLSHWEVEGLEAIVEWLSKLAPTKRQVPTDILDAVGLVSDIKRLIQDHKHDDQKLAITGEPIVKWPLRKKHKVKVRGHTTYFPKTAKGPKVKKESSGVRRRRVRCKKCEPCTRTECGECVFCKDMKKFGGPGRMKQTCISRQCIAPVLAHSAICILCNADELEAHRSGTTALMECGICWDIVHPHCLRDKNPQYNSDGVINEDLPSSWECPKCVDEGKQGQLKPRIQKGPAHHHEPAKPADSCPNSASSESDRECDNNSKDGDDLENKVITPPRRGRKPKSEADPKMLNGHTREASPASDKDKTPPVSGRRGRPRKVVPSEDTIASPPSKKMKLDIGKNTPQSSPHTRNATPVTSKREQTCHAPSPQRRALVQAVSPRGVGTRSPKTPLSPSGNRTTSRGRETGSDNDDNSNHKGQGDSRGRGSRSRSRSPKPGPSGYGNDDGGAGDGEDQGSGGFGGKRRREPSPSTQYGNIPIKQCKVVVHKYVVRPAPLPAPPKYCLTRASVNHILDRDVWLKVFSYLAPRDKARCMGVCKTWYRWSLDQRLWRVIDLSRQKIRQCHLVGIVCRQPKVLDVSWTNISRKQLVWLAARLPQLKKLYLAGNTWPGVSALCSSSCPLLLQLNLNWVTGIYDACIRDLVSPPIDHKPGVDESVSRLHRCSSLSLAGSDITDAALEVVVRFMPALAKLDLSYCSKLTNHGVRIMGCGEGNRLDLVELDLTGCNNLTDQVFQFLTFFKHLGKLSLQSCSNITLDGCQQYIHHAPNKNLQMAEDRFFETIL